MPQLNFIKQGKGPILVLSHALGSDLGMWDEVATALQSRYTVLRYDHRGHGKSEVVPGPYTIAGLAEDAAALIARQARQPVHFVGISMGGIVAQALAVRYPQWIRSVVVADAASHADDKTRARWQERIRLVEEGGIEAVADYVMARYFTPEFRADTENGGKARVAATRARLVATDPAAYVASCQALANMDFRTSNGLIHCPSLVVCGLRDEYTPPALSRAMAIGISGAQLRMLDTAHLSAVEQPLSFAKLVSDFLQSADPEETA
ncbi:MAG: alpha/beta fold hydrolase [Burkholderiaceae bacterium]|nr:alpha/beta fold hydrolase [Burkholderiaceae bacterium]